MLPSPNTDVQRRHQGKKDKLGRKDTSQNLVESQNIKLHQSENAWIPSCKMKEKFEGCSQNLEREKLKRSVQGVLNKLTPQKFETLLTQLKGLNIDTEEKLTIVKDLIFEKAIDEPNSSVPYANLCKRLALIKVPLGDQPGQQVNFRKLLLTKCQKEFEQDRTDELKHVERMKALEEAEPDKQKEMKLEFDMEEKKMRYRQLGNIRFIGELFKLGMLIEPIMHECIKKLLMQGDEESLECLCKLLTTIGKELDDSKATKGREQNPMEIYFNQMQKFVDKRLTSSRVRFMLQDVIDLKRPNTDVQRRHQGKKDKLGRKDTSQNLVESQNIKLHQSENAWIPSCKMKEKFEGCSQNLETESLKRNVQSVLNKLTFQKFKILLGHLKELNICTETEMNLVAELIYENAIYEPHFSVLYAKLCKDLSKIKIPISEKLEEQIDFVTVLLTKCQIEFEKHCNAQDKKINLAQDDNIKITKDKEMELTCKYDKKLKARRLGNIRFIGELFKLKLILKPVIMECMDILLVKQDEESLECLCLLIKTAGKELDKHENSLEEKEIEEYFIQIQKIVDEHLTSTRIRFLLKDILDLKNLDEAKKILVAADSSGQNKSVKKRVKKKFPRGKARNKTDSPDSGSKSLP